MQNITQPNMGRRISSTLNWNLFDSSAPWPTHWHIFILHHLTLTDTESSLNETRLDYKIPHYNQPKCGDRECVWRRQGFNPIHHLYWHRCEPYLSSSSYLNHVYSPSPHSFLNHNHYTVTLLASREQKKKNRVDTNIGSESSLGFDRIFQHSCLATGFECCSFKKQ